MSKFHAIYSKGGVSPEPGGDAHGEVQTLLWTNPNTKVAFGNKKIEIDLSNYDGVIVEFLDNASSSVQNVISRIKVEKNVSHANGGGFVSSGTSGVARNITAVDNTGVTIGNAFSSNENNAYVIPYRIYGYKQYEAGNLSMDANEIVVDANTDKQLDIKSYYLILGVSMATELSLSKGTLIGSIKQSHAGGNDVAAIVYTGDDGIINSAGNSLHIKKIEVG